MLVFGEGSTDNAYLYGSTSTDSYVNTPTYAYISGTVNGLSFNNVVENFANVYAYAGGGTPERIYSRPGRRHEHLRLHADV